MPKKKTVTKPVADEGGITVHRCDEVRDERGTKKLVHHESRQVASLPTANKLLDDWKLAGHKASYLVIR